MTDARWQVIVDAITSGIRSGTYPPGSRIPSVVQLMATHGVSRGVVTKATDYLKASGLVVGDQGVGTFVTDAPTVPAPTGVEAAMQALEARVAKLEATVNGIRERIDTQPGEGNGGRDGRRRRSAGASSA